MPQQLTRRALLARAATAGVAVALAPVIAPQRAFAARDPFWRMDATAQADLVRRGEVSPLELVEAAIERIERLDPVLNAVVAPLFDQARDMARGALPEGPFRGVPYLIKDLNDLAGAPTSNGSRLFADYVAAQSEPYVARTLAAGVIPVGKSNTPEFGLIATTESLQLGPCRNPWNTEFTPGGSSGGAAAAVAAGMVPFAHATDGGGSIRIPASCCGLFGLKPSTPPSSARSWGTRSSKRRRPSTAGSTSTPS
jgi:amidase